MMVEWLARTLAAGLLCASVMASISCCNEYDRRLDPEHPEPVYARLRMRYDSRADPHSMLDRLRPGDVLVFSGEDASSGGSAMVAAALGRYSHAAIAFRSIDSARELRVLTADSEEGVVTRRALTYLAGRSFQVYAFPQELLDLDRLARFAWRAAHLGRLDYDWSSACLALNSNLIPNALAEIDDEYTCATVVAAALHFSGLSLDAAHCEWQWVSPGDLVHSPARRNKNSTGQ